MVSASLTVCSSTKVTETECIKTHFSDEKKKNPCEHNGVQLKCLVYENIYHLAQNCPEKKSQDSLFSQETVLFETDYDHPAKLRNLVSESRNAAALDIGATNAATRTSWMNTYIDSLEKA